MSAQPSTQLSTQSSTPPHGELPVEIGIGRGHRRTLAERLNHCVASSYVLYAKTQAFHWNVQGPLFYSVHHLTEEQYTELAGAIDVMAERVRALGFPAVSGLGAILEASRIEDAGAGVPEASEMIRELADDHMRIAAQFREAIPAAEELDDYATADLLTQRVAEHEKASWMLTSLVTG